MQIKKENDFLQTNLNFRLGLNVAGSDISVFDSIFDKEQGLDIDFEIEKTMDQTPNESKITLWNVNPKTYNALKKSTALELYGAFGQEDYALMFMGTIERSEQKSHNSFLKQSEMSQDISTSLICYDAGLGYQQIEIARSYSGSVSADVIIKDCVHLMGLSFGLVDEVSYPMVTDYVARGLCVQVLTDITERCGLSYHITNGFFHLVQKGKEIETQGIILNGQNSNKPVFEEQGKQKGWKIETGLLPFLIPGTYCRCDFNQIQGIYRIYKVKHTGNNYGTRGITNVYVEES